MSKNKLQLAGITIPRVIFGTSVLGNLYAVIEESEKCRIIQACVENANGLTFFDSAGKYGAGLALESLGNCLKELQIKPEDVIISNKLAWVRTELKTPEPTFEPGVWKDLQFDAIQKISYHGILECFQQGNELLKGYPSHLVSIHDPDEYLATAKNEEEDAKLYNDILEAYKALFELKSAGKVKAIGIGAKDWKAIERISKDIDLDWVMIANSMTIKSHPEGLVRFMETLKQKGTVIINSAVFHGGFLIGGEYCDYKLVKPDTEENKALLKWREDFFELCKTFNISPAAACIQFGLSAPGVESIAVSTTNPKRVKENIDFAFAKVPEAFWQQMKQQGLIEAHYHLV